MTCRMTPQFHRNEEGMEICSECNGTGILDKYMEICYHCKGLGRVDWIKNLTDLESRKKPKFFYRRCYIIYKKIQDLFLSSIIYNGLSDLGYSIGRLIEEQHPFFEASFTYSKMTNEYFIQISERGSLVNIAFLCFSTESIPTLRNKNKQKSRGEEWKDQDMF
jgi:hypothetical protein